jgi:hypothetical protein
MCPLTKGVGGAHLKRARVASIPAPHPGYSLLGFRVLPPNPPSKEGFLPPNPPSKGGFRRKGRPSFALRGFASPQALAQTRVRKYRSATLMIRSRPQASLFCAL